MSNIQLVRLDPALEHTLTNDDEFKKALVQGNWVGMADVVHRVVGRTVASTSNVDELRWDGYFVVDEGTRELVGSCAFKRPPTQEGMVEIAYFTYPEFEGRGYATAMARKLVDLAGRSAAVKQVVAHTLPEINASTRVLQKVGMVFAGEVMDPDDGRVWRWQVDVGCSPARMTGRRVVSKS